MLNTFWPKNLWVTACAWAAAGGLLGPIAHGQMVGEQLGDGIARFHASANAQANAEPSIALEQVWAGIGPVPGGFSPLPSFAPGNPNRVTIPVAPGTSLYGTGLVAGPLERTGRRAVLYNDDSYAWGDWDEQLYQSHPWVLGVRADGTAFGVLFDSTWRSVIDTTNPQGQGIVFETEGPIPAVIVVDRESPQQVVMALSDLTGRPFMPPLWAVGYHQCRYSYTPASRALEVAQEFRNRQIPADTIWLDIDYMDGFRIFTFNPFTFPDPAGLNAALDSIDFSSIWMINPGVKLEQGYWIYDAGQAGDHWVKSSNTVTDFQGDVWPGLSKWPDFTRSATRAWWGSLYAPYMAMGIDGVWNDMNEPAVFGGPGWTMPDNNHHRADAALGGPGPHVKYHNVYGMLMARATREGILAANPDKRPFVLSRASYLGGHRDAASWTGDNIADWYHLWVSIPNVLNLGLSGQPFSGPDIGGFVGNGDAQLFARWMGYGALLPFARGHTSNFTVDKEPWSYGPAAEQTSRLALQRRYRLIHYYYTLFFESHLTGLPVARPLFFAEPQNSSARTWDDGFMIGDGIVVSVATTSGATPSRPPLQGPIHRFGFPETDQSGAAFDTDRQNLPHLYLRGGQIVPTGPIVQSTRDATLDHLTLLVALDENGEAIGQLYEDAGDGWEFEGGDFLLSTYYAQRSGNIVTVELIDSEGNRARPVRPLTVRLLTGDEFEVVETGMDGETIQLPFVEPPLPDATIIDGPYLDRAFSFADLLATQDTPTDSGNNINELNQLWLAAEVEGIRVGLSGNLGTDAMALALFFDTGTGRQSTLDTGSLSPPPAGLSALTGTTFDDGFAPSRLLFANAFGGALYCDWVTLPSSGTVTKRYLGQQSVGSGSGVLSGGNNPGGILVALDNRNVAGVTDQSAADAATATSGWEMYIPYSDLGLSAGSCGEIRVLGAIVQPSGAWTNQLLPPLGGTGAPGIAPDLSAIAGEQWSAAPLPPSDADLDGDGALTVEDLYLLHEQEASHGELECLRRYLRRGEGLDALIER